MFTYFTRHEGASWQRPRHFTTKAWLHKASRHTDHVKPRTTCQPKHNGINDQSVTALYRHSVTALHDQSVTETLEPKRDGYFTTKAWRHSATTKTYLCIYTVQLYTYVLTSPVKSISLYTLLCRFSVNTFGQKEIVVLSISVSKPHGNDISTLQPCHHWGPA